MFLTHFSGFQKQPTIPKAPLHEHLETTFYSLHCSLYMSVKLHRGQINALNLCALSLYDGGIARYENYSSLLIAYVLQYCGANKTIKFQPVLLAMDPILAPTCMATIGSSHWAHTSNFALPSSPTSTQPPVQRLSSMLPEMTSQ